MAEKRNMTCIVCPLGCSLEVDINNGQVENVKGNKCKRGSTYAATECINPVRTLTTTVKVLNGQLSMVPVKSHKPVPKKLLLSCMQEISKIEAEAPVHIGDILLENILGTGANIIATRNIGKNSIEQRHSPPPLRWGLPIEKAVIGGLQSPTDVVQTPRLDVAHEV